MEAARALILAVGERLFLEHGFDELTWDRVANECEVSVRTVQRYFPTKEALVLARARELVDRFKAGLVEWPGDAVSYWRHYVETTSTESGPR